MCCNQFIIGKSLIHSRPYSYWKTLHHMIGVRSSCHEGEPEYESLHAYFKDKRLSGPEPAEIKGKMNGYWTQGTAAEYLSHVMFGFKPLEMPHQTLQEACDNFYPNCGGRFNPCYAKYFPTT